MYKYCLFIQYIFIMAIDWAINDSNPRRKVTREELKELFSSCNAMNEHELTTEINDTGRNALHRFLALYVKYDCGVAAWQLWVDKMEKIADRHILLNYDGNLYAEPNETRNGQEWGMIVKWFYFDWYVRKKLKSEMGPGRSTPH